MDKYPINLIDQLRNISISEVLRIDRIPFTETKYLPDLDRPRYIVRKICLSAGIILSLNLVRYRDCDIPSRHRAGFCIYSVCRPTLNHFFFPPFMFLSPMASTSRSGPSSKPSRGRQRIEIRRRENVEERRVTFTKRRTGLFDKAAELCVLCGAKVVIVTFSEGRKAFCFGNPEPDLVIDGYLRERSPAEIGLSGTYIQALERSKQLYLEALRGLEREKANRRSGIHVAGPAGFWWDGPVDDLGPNELEFYHGALEKMMKSVAARIEGNNPSNVNHEDEVITDNFVSGVLKQHLS